MEWLLGTRSLFLCSTLLVIAAANAVDPEVTGRIQASIDPLLSTSETNNDVDPTEHPYLVSVMVYENKPKNSQGPVLLSHSAGVVISSSYVLDTKPEIRCNECLYTIRIWSDMEGTVVTEHKADLIHHTNHTKSVRTGFTSPNNIALYKLKKPIEFSSRANTVKLPRPGEEIVSGDRGLLVDWAPMENHMGVFMDNRVRETNVTVMDRRACSEVLERADQVVKMDGLHELPEGFFCAKSKIYCEECLEDHSSKLFVGSRLAGLSDGAVSVFIGDSYFRVSVFVDVARHRDWIQNYIGV